LILYSFNSPYLANSVTNARQHSWHTYNATVMVTLITDVPCINTKPKLPTNSVVIGLSFLLFIVYRCK